MKKIINIIILFVVCLLPTAVEAKMDYKLNWKINNDICLYKEDDKYYCLADIYNFYSIYIGDMKYYSLNTYDKNGKLIDTELFYDELNDDINEFKYSKRFKALTYYFDYLENDYVYDEETGMYYGFDYYSKYGYYYSYENNFNYTSFKFDTDLDFTKSILGKKYDIFYKIKNDSNTDYNIYSINELDEGYYSVLYHDYNAGFNYVSLLDKNLNEMFAVECINGYAHVWIYNDLIFICNDIGEIKAYDFDGKLIDIIEIDTSFLQDTSDYCGSYAVSKVEVDKMELTLNYNFVGCPERINVDDASELVNAEQRPKSYVINLNLIYNVIKVEPTGGDFTYDRYFDDSGDEIVELDIKPNDGYSVEDIIVTDADGNKIEVTDNKFVMPMSDVTVEVKFINGEYLPIPNTALSQSITVIIIGVILVGLGFYTINYVRSEEK